MNKNAILRRDVAECSAEVAFCFGFLDAHGNEHRAAIKQWVSKGGVLVASKSAAKWAADKKIGSAKFKEDKAKQANLHKDDAEVLAQTPVKRLPYDRHRHDRDSKLTKGCIFATKLDITHPLGYGYTSRDLAVFRNSNLILEPSRDPYATVAQYSADPLLAGYVHPENGVKVRDSAAITVERLDEGCVISFVDNPNFRGFWTGTSKLYLNALFFGSVIEKTDPNKSDPEAEHAHEHAH